MSRFAQHVGARMHRALHAVRAFRRDETGATVVEMAIVTPVLFMLLFAVVEFGITTYRWSTANEAARLGARMMMVRSTLSTRALTRLQLRDSLRARLADASISVDSLLWRNPDGTTGTNERGDRVRVVVSLPAARFTGLFRAMTPTGSGESTIVY